MPLYCTQCGAELQEGDFFCSECGSRLKQRRGALTGEPTSSSIMTSTAPLKVKDAKPHVASNTSTMTPVAPVKTQSRDVSLVSAPSSIPPRHAKKSNKRIFVAVTIGIIIIVGVLVASGFWIMSNFVYTEIASMTLEEPIDSTVAGIQVNITGSNVDVNVFSTDEGLAGSMFTVTERVLAPAFFSSASKNNYQRVNTELVHDDSANETWRVIEFNGHEDQELRYKLFLYVNPAFKVSFNINTDAGSVDLQLVNVSINGDFSATTSAGSIRVNVQRSTIQVKQLQLKSDAGSLDISLDTVNLTTVEQAIVKTSAGSIDLQHRNVLSMNNVTWVVQSDAGSINMLVANYLDVPTFQSTRIIQRYDVKTNVGSIDAQLNINDSFGWHYLAESSVGSITVNNDNNSPHEAQNTRYLQAILNYDFVFSSDVGSISLELS